jgi:ACS family tartrate transporter-like MFS transporter
MKARDIGQRLAPGKAKGQNGAGRAGNTSNNKGWRAGEPMTSPADAILSKAAWRLIPVMCLMYVASFLDRVNVGFAALTMNRDLNFSPEVFGFGSGIFFWGYFLFEVPSNLMLEKVGARAWMCRIMLTWGLLSMACAFVSGPVSFVVLRFLLGVAEAGLYPGMILYMTYWFPQATRARFIALFLAAVPAASVIGAPISGWLLGFERGLHGWQWMFLLEGIPSVILGFAVLWLLPDRPASARWLTPQEKQVITARLADDRSEDLTTGALSGFWQMLADKRIWIFIIPDFSIVIGLYGLNLWMPQMIKGLGFSNQETGFLVALPYIVAMIAMVAVGLSSDRKGERVFHVAGSALLGALGLLGAALLSGPVAILLAFCLASAGIYAALAVFWTLPTAILRGLAAAGGLALLNSFANLGGFFGPSLMGWAKQQTGTYSFGLEVLAGFLVLAAVSVIWIGRAFFAQPAGGAG